MAGQTCFMKRLICSRLSFNSYKRHGSPPSAHIGYGLPLQVRKSSPSFLCPVPTPSPNRIPMKPLSFSFALLLSLTSCQTATKKEEAVPTPVQQPSSPPQTTEAPAAVTSASGVVTTASGLQYRVLASGPADGRSPTFFDSVMVHYHGTLTDGTVFDSSLERGQPATFGVGQVIAGWTEALKMMKPGDKWLLYIPSPLAYGSRAVGGKIPPNSDLIFQVELLQVLGH